MWHPHIKNCRNLWKEEEKQHVEIIEKAAAAAQTQNWFETWADLSPQQKSW